MGTRWQLTLPAHATRLLVYALAVQAVIRGADYLLGDRDATTQTLAIAEQALPLPLWGVIFMVGGTLVLLGLRRRRARFIMSGAIWLFAAYGAVGWSLVLRILERATPVSRFVDTLVNPHWSLSWVHQLAVDFPLDGWRVPSSFFAAMVMWAAIGWGTQISARAWEVTRGPGRRTTT
ncbi:hypothetical protein [Corynebacterium heidelbergense]|uniref:Uncharacterized protein n=1 Tax=Corynebacterium heidelbergense TaxID=2055947 RepID=A0A364VCD7_9CORY|nr:hypothetical protein [Corynebacterium heidelbergense]RAV34268.1 hypothetical protein CWC39_04245 [Corynebacterium heidelbergense]WCZ36959.1 hypothetical protein CHEID_07130 [Corynebacterium heidelbergense]